MTELQSNTPVEGSDNVGEISQEISLGREILTSISVFVLLMFLPGCGAMGQAGYTTSVGNFAGTKFKSPQLITKEGYSKIYIFRDRRLIGSPIGFSISDNGMHIGNLLNGHVMAWERQPGPAAIGAASTSNEQVLTISAEAEMVYFFKAISKGGVYSARVEMRMLSPSDGKAQLIGRGILTQKARKD